MYINLPPTIKSNVRIIKGTIFIISEINDKIKVKRSIEYYDFQL